MLAAVVAFAVLLLLLLVLPPLLLVPALPVLADVMVAVEAACADASERVSSWLLLLRWREGGITSRCAVDSDGRIMEAVGSGDGDEEM